MSYLDLHRNEIFKKYTDDELRQDVNNFICGNGQLYKVLAHFFEERMYECCGKKTTLSPMQALSDDETMQKVIEYVKSKPKFFTSNDEIANVKSAFRNSFSWCRKVANFPAQQAKAIYNRYFPNKTNLNCLDTSCGFGSRMSAVLLTKNNYFGFDPNLALQKNLFECAKWYKDNGYIENGQICRLFKCGSEEYQPCLEGIMDVSFTSPPYFNLEKYSDDNSNSTKNYDNYQLWVKEFVLPTVINTYKYLKVGGYAMINIKNINKKETCYDDFFRCFDSIDGFEFVEVFDLTIRKKQYVVSGKVANINPNEPIMVFRKVR